MTIWDGLPPHVKLQKFGRIPDIDAGDTNEDVWDGEGAYPWLDAETTLTFSSSSANDAAAGTGARTARWFYMGDDYIEQTVDLTNNGQSASSTTVAALRIYRGFNLTAGTNTVNDGDMWAGSGAITNGVPANIYAGVLSGFGQTLMAIYTIPIRLASGKNISNAIIRRWYGTTSGAVQDARATVALQTREFGGAWRTRKVAGVTEGDGHEEVVYIEIPTKTDIRVRVINNGVNNTAIEAGFDIALLTKPG